MLSKLYLRPRYRRVKSKLILSKMLMALFASACAITVSAFRRKREAACLSNSLRPRQKAWEWDSPSLARSLKRTPARSTQKAPRTEVHDSILPYREVRLPDQ